MGNHKKTSNNSHNLAKSLNSYSPKKAGRKKLNSIKLCQIAIESIQPKQISTIFWFYGLKGFGIRVSTVGNKTWIIQYQSNGRTRKITIGKYPKMSLVEARNIYSSMMLDINLGIDPLEERQLKKKREKEDITVLNLLDLYIDHSKQTGKKTYENERRIILNGLGEEILNKRISQVTPREIAKVVRTKVDNGTPSAAQHLLKYTKRLFNYGSGLLLLEQNNNPCIGIKLNLPKRRRQRHLSPQEIYQFWHNIEKFPISPILKLSLKLLLCTVARSVEVRTMRWDDLDLFGQVWTMPTSKNGRMHRIYLGKLAMEIIKQVQPYTSRSEWVFGCPKHNGRGQVINEEQTPFRVWTLSQTFRRHFDKFDIQQKFYPHDLRRTGATMIAGLFGRRDFASLVLNHTTSDVTGIYDHYSYDKEKRMALEALNRAIELIANSPNAESVPTFDELRDKIIG